MKKQLIHTKLPFKPVTETQIAIYEFIERIYSFEDCSPSYHEIMREMNLSSGAVQWHVEKLIRANWLTVSERGSRALVPIKQPRVYYREA